MQFSLQCSVLAAHGDDIPLVELPVRTPRGQRSAGLALALSQNDPRYFAFTARRLPKVALGNYGLSCAVQMRMAQELAKS